MLSRLDDLTPAQLTIVTVAVTGIAALIAGVTAVTVALVNAWSARHLAQDGAMREYRLKTIRPYLGALDERITLLEQVISEGPRFSKSLADAKAVFHPVDQGPLRVHLDQAQTRLTALASSLEHSKDIYQQTAWWALTVSDQQVLDLTHVWLRKNQAFFERLQSWNKGITANPDQITVLTDLAHDALKAAVALRLAMEDFALLKRGWIRRSLYVLRSRVNDSLSSTST